LQSAILLCNQDVLECEKAFLETFGYTVLTTPSGGKGLELASIHSVDVVIVDYVMPEMNGGGVCNRNETAQAASANRHTFRSSGCSQASLEAGRRLHSQGSFVQPVVAGDRAIARRRSEPEAFV
jgi:CheY-like chemotaxis protein